MIKNLTFKEDGKLVSWQNDDESVSIRYKYSATGVLLDDNSILIVEPDDAHNPDNAVVYDADGDFVRRVRNPCRDKDAICFDSVYLSNDKVIMISVCPRVFYECRLSKKDGELINVNETR